MSTITTEGEKCPRCGFYEAAFVTDTLSGEESLDCKVCGYARDLHGEALAEPTYACYTDALEELCFDYTVPAVPGDAKKWIEEYEARGCTFRHAVIVKRAGRSEFHRLRWLRGDPKDFHEKSEELRVADFRSVSS
jgi:hypothetical protein